MPSFEISKRLTHQVWRQLHSGDVPGTAIFTNTQLMDWRLQINMDLRSHKYMPSTVHGYLGIEKNFGVTRFIPILTKEDMSVYYHLCGSIGGHVIKDVRNVFGGWRSIPSGPVRTFSQDEENRAQISQQNYYSSPFSSAAWFQQFRDFNEVIRNLVETGAVGNYVVKTDVANFYDSIDVGRLVRRLRKDAPTLNDEINLLELFLGHWNRRTSGYQTSSRGIPQEIISDGSRNLSHYYLQEFDQKFIRYCRPNDLVYVRWADDILVFGPSRKSLENAVHMASQFLLAEGLNLNASKTQVFSRRNFEKYRALKILSTIERKDYSEFQSELKMIMKNHAKDQVKLDTVFRAAVGFVATQGVASNTQEVRSIFQILNENPEYIGGLNSVQLFRLLKISGNPASTFSKIVRGVSSKQVTAPKATVLTLIRKTAPELKRVGIDSGQIRSAIKEIEGSSHSSDIINQLCLPQAKSAIEQSGATK